MKKLINNVLSYSMLIVFNSVLFCADKYYELIKYKIVIKYFIKLLIFLFIFATLNLINLKFAYYYQNQNFLFINVLIFIITLMYINFKFQKIIK